MFLCFMFIQYLQHAIFSFCFLFELYCNLPYCHILPTSIFFNGYFCILLRHICLFITFNAVGINFILIALLIYYIAPDKVHSSPRKFVPLIKSKSTLVHNFSFSSDCYFCRRNYKVLIAIVWS